MLYSLIFDRGHGSVLDNQFYVELRKDGILRHSVVDHAAREIRIYNGLPLSDGDWTSVADAAALLELKKAPRRFFRKLFARPVVDGPRYWRLMLVTQKGKRLKKTAYVWQHTEQYRALEQLLERIASDARMRADTNNNS